MDTKVRAIFSNIMGGCFRRSLSGNEKQTEIGIKVESVADFLAANGLDVRIAGEPLSAVRKATVAKENGTALVVMERNGTRAWDLPRQIFDAGDCSDCIIWKNCARGKEILKMMTKDLRI